MAATTSLKLLDWIVPLFTVPDMANFKAVAGELANVGGACYGII